MADEQPPRAPLQGRIRSVRGRNTKTPERGLPKISEIVLEHDDGQIVEALLDPVAEGTLPVETRSVVAISPGFAPNCPICLVARATTAEHVPPKAFGGRVMTSTCARCNNGLGSRTESAMQDWFDGAFRVSYTSGDDPQPFGSDRAFFRQTADGEFVIMAERAQAEGEHTFRQRVQPGARFEMNLSEPRPAEYRTGFLKSAYLAAALHLRGLRDVPSVRETQAELLAARDAKRRDVVLGPRARALRFHRTRQPASGPPLAIMRVVGEEQAEPRYLISLAGTILVEWPFPEICPVD